MRKVPWRPCCAESPKLDIAQHVIHHLFDALWTCHTMLFYVQAALLSMNFPAWRDSKFGTLQNTKAVE